MEAFSLLKYWKGGGGGGGRGGGGGGFATETAASKLPSAADSAGTTTIVNSVAHNLSEDDDASEGEGEGDEGPFFDLEFSVPVEEGEDEDADDGSSIPDEEEEEEEKEEDSDGTEGGDTEFKFRLSSSGSSGTDRADPNLALSPSDDLFFKGRLVAFEPPPPPSLTGADPKSAAKQAEATAAAAQFSASFLKSAMKFRVFMLGLKKSRTNSTRTEKSEGNNGSGDGDKPAQQQRNLFTVKFKVEEVPLVSLFKRDNSSRNSSSSSSSSSKKQNGDETAVLEEKRFVMMQKYLKKMKPLYVRVSRRYSEKLRFSGQLSCSAPSAARSSAEEKFPSETSEAPATAPAKNQKQINIPAGLKVVRKHLGKSRSASSAVPATPQTAAQQEQSRRRDDSLIQQQDGIQGAILHCKRSFNSSRDPEASVLARSVSDPSYEKSMNSSKKSSD